MPNYRMMLTMLARGGTSQADVAAVCGCSKRDVSRAAAVLLLNNTSNCAVWSS